MHEKSFCVLLELFRGLLVDLCSVGVVLCCVRIVLCYVRVILCCVRIVLCSVVIVLCCGSCSVSVFDRCLSPSLSSESATKLF